MTKLDEVEAAIAARLRTGTVDVMGTRVPVQSNPRELARAAIAALREPSETMLAAANEPLSEVNAILGMHQVGTSTKLTYKDGKPPLYHAWQAMLGAVEE